MSKFENMAKDIYNFCIDNDIWSDCIIYFDGMALSGMIGVSISVLVTSISVDLKKHLGALLNVSSLLT